MRKTIITEVGGQWVVSVEAKDGRRQEYVCETLVLAKRWARLFGVPPRTQVSSAVRAQPEA